VRQCVEVGLVQGKHVSVDGSFVEANASKESRVPREQLAEAAQVHHTVRQYLVELEEQNPVEEPVHQQDQVSTTDPDSTYATKGGTPARLGYYDNCLVDNDSCVIVGAQGARYGPLILRLCSGYTARGTLKRNFPNHWKLATHRLRGVSNRTRRRCNYVFWRKVAHGHVLGDVTDSIVPVQHPLRCVFWRKVAHGHILGDVIEFVVPDSHPVLHGPDSLLLLLLQTQRGLRLGGAVCQKSFRGYEGHLLLDSI